MRGRKARPPLVESVLVAAPDDWTADRMFRRYLLQAMGGDIERATVEVHQFERHRFVRWLADKQRINEGWGRL